MRFSVKLREGSVRGERLWEFGSGEVGGVCPEGAKCRRASRLCGGDYLTYATPPEIFFNITPVCIVAECESYAKYVGFGKEKVAIMQDFCYTDCIYYSIVKDYALTQVFERNI